MAYERKTFFIAELVNWETGLISVKEIIRISDFSSGNRLSIYTKECHIFFCIMQGVTQNVDSNS